MTEKIDVLALAREAIGGVGGSFIAMYEKELNEFVSAILERAAVECLDTDVVEDRGGMSYYAQLGDASATRDAIAEAIRALKPNQ